MSQHHKAALTRDRASEQEMHDQEVLRANKELAAYFSGQRTEREARAALKVIKAFVRGRERLDARSRPPLPGATPTRTPKTVANRRVATDRGEPRQRKPRRTSADTQSVTTAVELPAGPERPESSPSDDRTGE
jgi:hypothetical protein